MIATTFFIIFEFYKKHETVLFLEDMSEGFIFGYDFVKIKRINSFAYECN